MTWGLLSVEGLDLGLCRKESAHVAQKRIIRWMSLQETGPGGTIQHLLPAPSLQPSPPASEAISATDLLLAASSSTLSSPSLPRGFTSLLTQPPEYLLCQTPSYHSGHVNGIGAHPKERAAPPGLGATALPLIGAGRLLPAFPHILGP